MYQDTEKIAEALWDRHFSAVEIDPAHFEQMSRRAEPGWDPFDFPENYRWFLIRDFPVKELDVTLRRLMKDARDPGQEKFQHDRIIELWKKGAPEWPAFVTATGVIADGYHRTAAHRTLGHKTMDVIVSVAAKHAAYPQWRDEMWLDAFPRKSGPSISGPNIPELEVDEVDREMGNPGYLMVFMPGDREKTFLWAWYGYGDEIADRLLKDDYEGLEKYVRRNYPDTMVAYLANMEVAPRKTGKGIGTALLRKTLDILREKGVGAVFLHRSESDRSSHEQLKRLYNRFGFKDSRCCKADFSPVMDRIL